MIDGGSTGRLAGRLALITGASRGLGAAVAERFAAEGARLILAARTVGGLEATDDRVRAAGGTATLIPVDLTEAEAVERLAAAIYQRFGGLDIVVANAARLGALSPVAHGDPELWQTVLDLNLVSTYRLIRAVHPLLAAAEAGRAVFVTCGVGHTTAPFWNAYAVSKAGLEMLARLYAAEVARTAIRVNLLDPGPLRTKLRATAFPGERPDAIPAPEDLTEAFVHLAEPACSSHGALIEAAEPEL